MSRSSSGGARAKPDEPDSSLQIRAPRGEAKRECDAVPLRVRSAPSRAARHPLPYPEAPAGDPPGSSACIHMPRHGRDRPLWPRARRSLGRIGAGPRSDHVEILSPCVRCMDKRASRRHNPAEVRTGRIGAGTGIFTGRNRHRNRERVRFRHNCPNPPFGRETHVDGAWLGPGAFGRATRDLFPRSNDTGRESIGMAPRVRLGRRADNAQDGSQCPVSTSSGHCAMAGGTSQLRQAGLRASPSRRTAVRPKWADRRLGSPRFLNAFNRRSRRRYHARAPPNGE